MVVVVVVFVDVGRRCSRIPSCSTFPCGLKLRAWWVEADSVDSSRKLPLRALISQTSASSVDLSIPSALSWDRSPMIIGVLGAAALAWVATRSTASTTRFAPKGSTLACISKSCGEDMIWPNSAYARSKPSSRRTTCARSSFLPTCGSWLYLSWTNRLRALPAASCLGHGRTPYGFVPWPRPHSVRLRAFER